MLNKNSKIGLERMLERCRKKRKIVYTGNDTLITFVNNYEPNLAAGEKNFSFTLIKYNSRYFERLTGFSFPVLSQCFY